MDSSTIHILTFPSQNLLHANIKDLTNIPNQDILGIWTGKCLEDPELTLVVVGESAEVLLIRRLLTALAAGFPDGLDSLSLFGLTPKQQQRTEVSVSALIECLNAPVTEVASMVLKAGCDRVQAISLIDAAMQTVLDADDCIAAVWKTNTKETLFLVGWRFLEVRSCHLLEFRQSDSTRYWQAHKKYHQVIFVNPPDCIKRLPSIVDTNVVFHVAFRQIHGANKA